MIEFFQELLELIEKGGFVMPPLVVAVLVLWYVIGYRYALLRRGNPRSVRRLVTRYIEGYERAPMGVIDNAVVEGLSVAKLYKQNLRSHLDSAFYPYNTHIKRYSRLIMIIVMVAPLTGLLGTVVGMIETFDSLMDANLFTQGGGGIAGGISQALFTTQMGLLVAIPGLLMGRALDRRQNIMERELDQLKDILCSELSLSQNSNTDSKTGA